MKRLLLIVTLLALLVLAGASLHTSAQTISTGELRVINALVGLGPVDVYLNQNVIHFGLEPEQATPYFAVRPGQHSIEVRPVGADPLSAPIADALVEVNASQSITSIAYQQRFTTVQTGDNGLQTEIEPPLAQSGAMYIIEDNRSPIPLGRTRLTAAHLAPGSPDVLSVAYPSRASILHEVRKEAPYGDIDIDAGVYGLALVDAESADLDRLTLAGQVGLFANTHYTVVIVPDINPPDPADVDAPAIPVLAATPRLFIVSAPIDPPADGIRLRLIHAAHDTAVVDVYIDERLVAPRMNYSRFTEYLGIGSYSHTIALRLRDADPESPPLATAQFSITPENIDQDTWTILLLNAGEDEVPTLPLVEGGEAADTGDADEPSFEIINTPGGPLIMRLVPDNIAQTQQGFARVRLLHAIEGALDVSLYTPALPTEAPDPDEEPVVQAGPTPTPAPPVRLVEPVVYGAEANESEAPQGLYEELDFLAGGTTSIATLVNKPLIDGLVYTFVLIGQPVGEPPIEVLELVEFGQGIPQARLYLGVITSNTTVNIRQAASETASVVARLPNDTEVEVLGRNFNGDWVRIRFLDPDSNALREGWVFGPLITVTRLGDPINRLSLPEYAQ